MHKPYTKMWVFYIQSKSARVEFVYVVKEKK